MASHRVLTVGPPILGMILALTACAPTSPSDGVGYETVIAAVLRAETDAGGRAFDVEVDDGTAEVRVAVGDRAVDVDVDLSGPAVTGNRDDGDVDPDDRRALDTAPTTLADGIRVAAAAHDGGGSVSEVELRTGDDAVWAVAFTDGAEVAVAVTDGTVQRNER